MPFENLLGRGENAGNQHFLLFSQGFLDFYEQLPPFDSIQYDKILDLSKLEAFADNNLNVYQKLKFALGRVENIVGKGENAG